MAGTLRYQALCSPQDWMPGRRAKGCWRLHLRPRLTFKERSDLLRSVWGCTSAAGGWQDGLDPDGVGGAVWNNFGRRALHLFSGYDVAV